MVDTSNAFNSLNRQAALLNMFHLCPPSTTILTNIYCHAASLLIDGTTIWSHEDTTQGNPLAMSMYAISLLLLVKRLSSFACQVWYADDAVAEGNIVQLWQWWDHLVVSGPHFDYFTNAKKTWLVVKTAHLQDAQSAFAGSGIQVTSAG